ncbi:hypothetical protein [Agrococcus terreus]|uniref:PIN domain-containing protein n=1 Tax=Agrococcus terreus TaxID=574649 RepID=A0ABQ2KM34_9MICO|nr:hypothetical protein [Agrococcus terreus]GGN86394.1 hypothetical protein GCM10010968_19990 [Agrococcus terreus]
MTRFAIDAPIALRIVAGGTAIAEGHQLVGPAILRSHALAALYRDVREGRRDERDGRAALEGIAGLRIRLLGDRVSRATAWRLALERGLDDPALAEYVAVAVLQADLLVTDDPALAAIARGAVPVIGWDAFARDAA